MTTDELLNDLNGLSSDLFEKVISCCDIDQAYLQPSTAVSRSERARQLVTLMDHRNQVWALESIVRGIGSGRQQVSRPRLAPRVACLVDALRSLGTTQTAEGRDALLDGIPSARWIARSGNVRVDLMLIVYAARNLGPSALGKLVENACRTETNTKAGETVREAHRQLMCGVLLR